MDYTAAENKAFLCLAFLLLAGRSQLVSGGNSGIAKSKMTQSLKMPHSSSLEDTQAYVE